MSELETENRRPEDRNREDLALKLTMAEANRA